jgi:hypothetical protein
MKVKIFRNWQVEDQEEEINRWMEVNSNIVIQHILQSTGASDGGTVYTIITIFYSELEFEKVK